VRRTEGRTGLALGARGIADGNAVFDNLDVRTVRHKTCRRSARRIFGLPTAATKD
jgi:hypothetical protein